MGIHKSSVVVYPGCAQEQEKLSYYTYRVPSKQREEACGEDGQADHYKNGGGLCSVPFCILIVYVQEWLMSD